MTSSKPKGGRACGPPAAGSTCWAMPARGIRVAAAVAVAAILRRVRRSIVICCAFLVLVPGNNDGRNDLIPTLKSHQSVHAAASRRGCVAGTKFFDILHARGLETGGQQYY